MGNLTDWRTDPFKSAPSLNLGTVYSSDSLTAVNNVYGNPAGKFNMLAPTTVTGFN